jgi:hypothetical protein
VPRAAGERLPVSAPSKSLERLTNWAGPLRLNVAVDEPATADGDTAWTVTVNINDPVLYTAYSGHKESVEDAADAVIEKLEGVGVVIPD